MWLHIKMYMLKHLLKCVLWNIVSYGVWFPRKAVSVEIRQERANILHMSTIKTAVTQSGW